MELDVRNCYRSSATVIVRVRSAAVKREFIGGSDLASAGSPNQTEPDGTTPLHWAVQQDRLDIVQALISAGANVNAKNRYGSTPLVLAATNGNASVTEVLLKAGADVRVSVPETGSVLIAAARTGNPEVIKLLLAAGADVNFAERYSGQTALMWAAAEGHSEAVKALLAGGAKVEREGARQEDGAVFCGSQRRHRFGAGSDRRGSGCKRAN